MAAIRGLWVLALVASFGCRRVEQPTSVITAPSFADAVAHRRPLTRAQRLEFMLERTPAPPAVLLSALTSQDVGTRLVAALQLGELGADDISDPIVNALLSAASDPDAGVSTHAVASLIRIGRTLPSAVISLLPNTTELKTIKYASDRANGQRSLRLTASDVAVTGLYYAAPTSLNGLMSAFVSAKQAEPPAAPADPDAHHERPAPTRSDYYSRALSLLLERAADANRQLIDQMLSSDDAAMRMLGYRAAKGVMLARDEMVQRLALVVQESTEPLERSSAAEALAGLGSEGEAQLVQLAGDPQSSVRAAAIAVLVHGSDCNSPRYRLLAEQREPLVLEAAVTSVLHTTGWSKSLECLFAFSGNAALPTALRTQMLEYAAEHDGAPCDGCTPERSDRVFDQLRPTLDSASAQLAAAGWRVVRRLPQRSPSRDAVLMQLARTLIARRPRAENSEIFCTLASLDRKGVADDRALIRLLVRSIGGHDEQSECVSDLLARIEVPAHEQSGLSSSVMSRLRTLRFLSEADQRLLASELMRASFATHWRQLASHFKGVSRLAIYRIALSRGLAVDESLALFTAVLAGDVTGVGTTRTTPASNYESDYDLRWRFLPEAIEALYASGARGHVLLAQMLRGERGSTEARLAVMFPMIQVDRDKAQQEERIRQLAGELGVAARSDRYPDVRARAISALAQLGTGKALVEVIRPLFKDTASAVASEITRLVMEDSSELYAAMSETDAQQFVSTLLDSRDPHVRADALPVLARVGTRVSASFVARSLERVLRDDSHEVRFFAFGAMPDLGAVAVETLARLLDEPEADKLLDARLATTLTQLGAAARPLLPRLMSLHSQNPDGAPIVRAIAAIDGDTPEVRALLEHALLSNEPELRDVALHELSRRSAFFAQSSPSYYAALIEARASDELAERMGLVLESIRPYVGGVPLVLHSPPAPHFPWPPARASFEQSLATERLGAADVQLGAAAEKLVAGLREAGMQRPELSEIATGFFLAGQLEAIHPDGTPLAGRKRWNASVGRSLSFDDYLLDLFFEPPGHYRAVAMAVTGSDAAERMRPSHATYFGFGSALSQPIAALTLEARRVTAFVYTFQRERGGVLIPGYQGSPDGMTHLKASGLLDVIDR